jgi:hypothetical protein
VGGAILGLAASSFGQDAFMGNEAFLELLRSDMKKETTAIITTNMQFSAEEAAAFWPIYKNYTDQLGKLGDRRVALIKTYASSVDSLSDDNAGKMAKEWLDIQESRTVLLGDLYRNVSSALSPARAFKVMQLEHRFNLVIDSQIANELPMVE